MARVLLLFPTAGERAGILDAAGSISQGVKTAITGVGPIDAGVSTVHLLSKGGVDLVILAGIAGVYRRNPGGLAPGAVCVATVEVAGDLGRAVAGGVAPLVLDGEELRLKFLLEEDISAAEEILGRRVGLQGAPMATVMGASGDPARAAAVARFSRAWCENMEGAAVCAGARRFGLPLLEIRGLSNWAGETRRSLWRMDEAMKGVGRALRRLLGR